MSDKSEGLAGQLFRSHRLAAGSRTEAGRNDRSAWLRGAAALGLYVVASVLFFGRQALSDPSHVCACNGSPDTAAYMWGLAWWPHAIAHAINPFISTAIWAPDGINLAANAAIPAPSLLMAPVTELFGPIASYNVLSLVCPALAAWFAFLLCRYVSRNWWASLAGGYVFGFSTYEIAQLTGHLNLVFIFLVPAAVHLVLLRLDARVSRRRFVVLLAIVLLLLLGSSTEMLFTLLSVGALTLLLSYLLAPRWRPVILALVPELLVTGVVACVVASPFLYYAVKGLGPNPTANWTEVANLGSADPLNYLLPTPVTWLAHGLDTSLALKFNHGNFSESDAYVGLPVLVILVMFLYTRRRDPLGRVLLAVLVVVVIASLGPHLHVANPAQPANGTFVYRPSIPLPWLPLTHLPAFKQISPVRLTMYVALICAVVVSLWLAAPGRLRWARWLLGAVVVASLIPNLSEPYWHDRPHIPGFFASNTYQRYMTPGERVLIFPFGVNGNSMLWQAQTHFAFEMTEGYIGIATPPSYYAEPIGRYMQYGSKFQLPLAQVGPQLKAFIRQRHVQAIIIDTSAPTAWSLLVPVTLHLHAIAIGGVQLYRVPASWLTKL